MEKSILKIILLVSGCLTNPIGILLSFFSLWGNGGFLTQSTNVGIMNPAFMLSFLAIAGFYNLIFMALVSSFAWFLDDIKYSFSHYLGNAAFAHLSFLPMVLALFLMMFAPLEGNIVGFIILPLFILLSLGCFIAFFIWFSRRNAKHPKPDRGSLKEELNTLKPEFILFGVLLLGTVFSYRQLNLRSSEPSIAKTIISFKHDDFEWGIGLWKPRFEKSMGVYADNEVFLFIERPKDKNPDKKFMPLYQIMELSEPSLFCNQKHVVFCHPLLFEKGKGEAKIQVENLIPACRPDTTINRLMSGRSIYFFPNRFRRSEFDIICADFQKNHEQLNHTIQSLLFDRSIEIEALVFGKVVEINHWFDNGNKEDGSYYIDNTGKLSFSPEENPSIDRIDIGLVKEGTLYFFETEEAEKMKEKVFRDLETFKTHLNYKISEVIKSFKIPGQEGKK